MQQQTEVEKQIGDLEIAVDRLRSLYEQYFMGIEKLEPMVPRKDVDRRIHLLRKEQVRNTALRFRFQMIIQRYNTYQTHWQRICREIENGTYKRHLVRARQRFGSSRPPPRPEATAATRPEPGAELPKEIASALAELDRDFAPPEFEVDVDVDLRELAPRPAVPAPSVASPGRVAQPPPRPPPLPPRPPQASLSGLPPPRPAQVSSPVLPPRPPSQEAAASLQPSPPRAVPPPLRLPSGLPSPARPSHPQPAPAPPAVAPPAPVRPATVQASLAHGNLPEERLRQIYSQYVEVKRRQNESTASITYQAVAKSLRESGEKLREKHGKAVDFEVAVKDGKTILKPILK